MNSMRLGLRALVAVLAFAACSDGDGSGGRGRAGDGSAGEGGSGGPVIRDPSLGPGDTDGDGIHDQYEGSNDTDGDGLKDYEDDDSDGDGITDGDEAGDGKYPVDTDHDGIPDFLDPDSDDDGVSDADEEAGGTARLKADTDGDGVTDLVEIVACAGEAECADDATDKASSPRTRGNFVFLEPYEDAPDPPRDTLGFSTSLRSADLYFLVDTTGSMQPPIDALKKTLATPMTGIIARVRDQIPDTWFGVGEFRDYALFPYGMPVDYVYRHVLDMQMDAAEAEKAIGSLTLGDGADSPEAHLSALTSVVTGSGLPGPSGTMDRAMPCPPGRWGYPCFRDGAVPIVVLVTDANIHNVKGDIDEPYNDAVLGGHAPTLDETAVLLKERHVRIIGIGVKIAIPRMGWRSVTTDDIRILSEAIGSVDETGHPFISEWQPPPEFGPMAGTEVTPIADGVVSQIEALSRVPVDVSVVYRDDPSDAIDSYAAFVDHLEANEKGDAALGCDPRAAEDTDGDGHKDTFRAVTPGNPVCFDIIVKENATVEPMDVPQLFKATLDVVGDGLSVLDSRDVFFLVPPEIVVKGPD